MRDRVSRVVGELVELLAGGKDDLAASADVSYASLHAWSSGRRTPSRDNAAELARVARVRAARVVELAELLSHYARTGELGAEAIPDPVRLEERPRLDREQLREIRSRARKLQETAGETIDWIRREELENGGPPDS